MESGWVITYKSGNKIIMNEAYYEWFKYNGRDDVIDDIQSEGHWFNIDDAIKSNPGADFLITI